MTATLPEKGTLSKAVQQELTIRGGYSALLEGRRTHDACRPFRRGTGDDLSDP